MDVAVVEGIFLILAWRGLNKCHAVIHVSLETKRTLSCLFLVIGSLIRQVSNITMDFFFIIFVFFNHNFANKLRAKNVECASVPLTGIDIYVNCYGFCPFVQLGTYYGPTYYQQQAIASACVCLCICERMCIFICLLFAKYLNQ